MEVIIGIVIIAIVGFFIYWIQEKDSSGTGEANLFEPIFFCPGGISCGM